MPRSQTGGSLALARMGLQLANRTKKRRQRGGAYTDLNSWLERYYSKQRGSGLVGDLGAAMVPAAKQIATQAAIEAAKLGMNKLTNKLGLKKSGISKNFGPPPKRRRRKRTPRGQKGGLFPLLALLPAAIAAGKAAGLGAVGAAAGYGVKRGLQELG